MVLEPPTRRAPVVPVTSSCSPTVRTTSRHSSPLLGEVPVEGGASTPELPGQAAEGERLRALDVHERDRLLDDLLPAESGAPAAGAAT